MPIPLPALGVMPQEPLDPLSRLVQLRQIQGMGLKNQAEQNQNDIQKLQIKETQRQQAEQQIIRESWVKNQADPDAVLADVSKNPLVSPATLQALQLHSIDLKSKMAQKSEAEIKVLATQNDNLMGLLKPVYDLPADTPPAQIEAIYQKQRATALQNPQFYGINPQQMPPSFPGKQMGAVAMAGMQGAAAQYERRLKEGQTEEAFGKGAEATASAQQKNAQTAAYQGTGLVPGVPPEEQSLMSYMRTVPGASPAKFPAWKAQQEAVATGPAKLHLAIAEKAAEQAIADGDPRAAAQLLVSGTVAPSQLVSSRKPAFAQQAFTAAAQMQPGWSATKADADYKVASSPTNVAFFGSAKSLTDRGGTLDQLSAAARDIPSNQIPIFNSVADALKASTGSGPIARYAAIALGVADDYSKVMGGGQGSDTSRTQALQLVSAKQSPEQREASIEGIRGSVSSQINSRMGNNAVLRKMYAIDQSRGNGTATKADPLGIR